MKSRGRDDKDHFGGLPLLGAEDFPMEEVCAEMEEMVNKGRWPGFVACGFTGEDLLDRCVFTKEMGKADLKRGTAMGLDTVVRIYSMTKAFVSVGVLRLHDRGLLGLDDPVHLHLPEPIAGRFRQPTVEVECEEPNGLPGLQPKVVIMSEESKAPITIRQLLCHSSGMGSDIATGLDALGRKRGRWEGLYYDLSSAVDSGQINTLGAFIDALSKIPLWQHPGKEFYYSYGYDVLGYMLEQKSGLPLDAFLRKEVFAPLGMQDTGFFVPRAGSTRLAQLYRFTKSSKFGGDGKHPALHPVESRFVEGKHCHVLSGGGCVSSRDGGLVSTLRDYSKFLVAALNGGAIPGSRARLVSKASAAVLMQNHCAKVAGLGKDGQPKIFAHNRRGVGLNCLGEIQLEGLEPDPKNEWFDGVPGLVQWGGAASTFYKYQCVNGRPLLLIFFTQVLPQDDGRTITSGFSQMRNWAEALPAKRRKRGTSSKAEQVDKQVRRKTRRVEAETQ